MIKLFNWLWKKGVLNNFVSGALVIMPIIVTGAVIGWGVDFLRDIFGKETIFGQWVREVGGYLVNDYPQFWAFAGWGLVLLGIWFIGLLFRMFAKLELQEALNSVLSRIPLFNLIYKPVSQVFGLMQTKDESSMKGMSVVFCRFGDEGGGNFLGLLATPQAYLVDEQELQLVYVPTSPVPMSGGLIFVPANKVTLVPDMTVDDLMKIYFSLGVLTNQVIPEKYRMPPGAKMPDLRPDDAKKAPSEEK